MDIVKKEHAEWFYDSSHEPWAQASHIASTTPIWNRYQWIEIQMIEKAYQSAYKEVRLGKYRIDLKNFIQVKLTDESKRRRVKRDNDSVRIDDAFKHRLYDELILPGAQQRATTYGTFDAWCPFLNAWLQSPAGKRSLDNFQSCIEPCAQGIIQEAIMHDSASQAKAAQMAAEIRQDSSRSRRELAKLCIKFYTDDSFLYYALNTALRECDLSKLNTFGPFVYLLSSYARICKEFFGVVYRCAQLNTSHVQEYRKALGMWKSWPAYTSTSKSLDVASMFGNTLFIIKITNTVPSCPRSFDISSWSQLRFEEEVLIPPGIVFQIISVNQNPEERTTIHLTI
jgi:hypothetical protein